MTNDAAVAVDRYDMFIESNGYTSYVDYLARADGDWVRYDDHATTVAELRARVAELEAGARELRRAFIFRQAVVASAETPEKLDFADDKVWAAAEKVRELLEKSP